jgi:hypothetical protein
MNRFKINIHKIVYSQDIPPDILEQGVVSSSSQPTSEDVCDLITDPNCYIRTSMEGAVTSGDIVYSDESGLNPIVGESRFYKIILINIYVVSINDFGVITVDSICP